MVPGLKLYRFLGVSGKRVVVQLIEDVLKLRFHLKDNLLFAIDEYGESIGPLNSDTNDKSLFVFHNKYETAGLADILYKAGVFTPKAGCSEGNIIGTLDLSSDLIVNDASDGMWTRNKLMEMNLIR